jgi:hypothetical protein
VIGAAWPVFLVVWFQVASPGPPSLVIVNDFGQGDDGEPLREVKVIDPQNHYLNAADRITGSLLDAGCDTGDTALYFAWMGKSATVPTSLG